MRHSLITRVTFINHGVPTMATTATRSLLLACFFLLLPVGCTTTTDAMEDETPDLPPPYTDVVYFDGDLITVNSAPRDLNGRMEVCLEVQTESGRWKGIGLNETDPSLEAEKTDGLRCTMKNPSEITVHFWKAGFLGIHTNIGKSTFALGAYGDHRITFTWTQD